MNVFEAMKGPGKRLFTIVRGSEEFHLLGYRDGSFGIARNHQSLSTWEPDEREACLSALMRITGWHESDRSILVMRLEKDEGSGVYPAGYN
jgi:hypothetical protein